MYVNLDILPACFNKRIKHSFRVLTFAKPECDNVLQQDPRSGEDYNILLHEGLQTLIHGKDNCYIVIVIYLPF